MPVQLAGFLGDAYVGHRNLAANFVSSALLAAGFGAYCLAQAARSTGTAAAD